jgi:nucleotide-binding universal stress UspA family protein
MFGRILAATDLSEASREVFGHMGALKALGSREVVLVHCLNIHDATAIGEALMNLCQPALDEQRRLLEAQGFKAQAELTIGLPHKEIERIAARKDCSLIVVGSIGQTQSQEVLLGGVASAIIHNARRPVLIIRVEVVTEEGRRRCKVACDQMPSHVLHPTDFSDNAEHAFGYVKRLVGCGVKKVTLMHVQDKVRIGKHLRSRLAEFNEIDRGRLERMKLELMRKGATDVSIAIPYGAPVKEILKRARDENTPLIVMGSQGRGFIRDIFLGSVSHNVARHAQTCVLLIPALR